jgi:hypothetical protein
MAKKQTVSAGQRIYDAVRLQYPDAYVVPGIGWCGPDYDKASTLAGELSMRDGLFPVYAETAVR